MKKDIYMIGGGPLGISAACVLSDLGYKVTILESGVDLMGLASTFDYEGVSVEVFYHFFYNNDYSYAFDFLNRIEPEGFDDENDVHWVPVSTDTFTDAGKSDFDSLSEFLRLAGKDVVSAFYNLLKLRFFGPSKKLEFVKATNWIVEAFGQEQASKVWEPLIFGKFGEYSKSVSAYWLATRIRRHMSTKSIFSGKSKFGYLIKTYKYYADRFEEKLYKSGGKVLKLEKVKEIVFEGNHAILIRTNRQVIPVKDAIVCSSIPLSALKHLVSHDVLRQRLNPFRSVGVVVCVLVMKRKLSEAYWTTVTRSDVEFQAVIQQNRLYPKVDEEIVYLSRYCSAESDLYMSPDVEIINKWVADLKIVFPDLTEGDIAKSSIFRAPNAAPVPIVDSQKHISQVEFSSDNFFFSGYEEIYPEDRGVGNSARLGCVLADKVIRNDLDA